MDRRAFNTAGRLGYFYDAYRDEIMEQEKLEVQGQGLPSSSSPQCNLVKGNDSANFNILQIIGVENELILSSLLNTKKKRSGIATVLNHPHCIDDCTRFLCYSWICRKQDFFKKNARIQEITGSNHPPKNATHVITSVMFGIDLIVVVQLPSEINIRHEVHSRLEIICDKLLKDKKGIFELSPDENDLLKKHLNIKVYSNVPPLTDPVEMSDVLRQINTAKKNACSCPPVSYHLEPIISLYSTQMRHSVTYSPLSKRLIDGIEQYILHVRNRMKYVKASLNENLPKLFCGHLQYLLNEAQNQYLEVKERFQREIPRFFNLVLAARHDGKKSIEQSNPALLDVKTLAMKKSIDELSRHVNYLRWKGQFITDLRQKGFEYLNLEKSVLNRCHDMKTMERMLINIDSCHRALCSSDTLNQSNESELAKLRQMLIKEHENQPSLRLLYLDFSYYSFPLQKITIIPSLNIDHPKIHSTQQPSLLNNDLKSSPNIPPSPPLTDEIINILLLGETGVGKSTFINAFANYLTFSSLEEAQTNEPVVLIPASFTMTIGDNFDEQTIKFGEFDSSNNENFNSVGQSVTQHCKSYVFALRQCSGKKLRIIDTPGFGDTRGLEQDDKNMEHILQYINNLTHLNAICFLLKPNSSRLNMFFRTCLTQLFSFLAPAARKNMIFCFTNGRSTFYTPGDTAPLLKAMLQSLSIKDIRFEKENTFCFDSESFRYLVALQNEVSFTEDDKREYGMSWSTSVKESNRLIDYIDKTISIYNLKSGWQSIKNAEFEITYMIRPILETMRNILRNIILHKESSPNEFIELHSKALHHTVTRCLSCNEEPQLVGKFWIVPSAPHEIQGDSRLCPCSCPPDHHVRMYYMLEYRCLHNASNRHKNVTNDILEELGSTSAKFALFLQSTADTTNGDPFLMGLEKMIDEEKKICQNQRSIDLNLKLHQKLTKLRELYESYKQKINGKKSNQKSIDLSDIYKSIDYVGKYFMVHEQMAAVKQSQQMMLKDYEHEVETI